MNSHVVLFLVLMVSTYVTSHFHSRGQEPVDDRNLMLNMMKRNMLARGRPRPETLDLSPNTLGRGNKPPTRRLLQPVVIRPNIYRPTQPGVGQNDAFEMQEFMRLLPFLSMTEAGEGMADMMLPMMLMQGSGQF
ncbi:uncharacterized protein LOC128163564 [Crassostrea angulata]|uniref:uncharacterized protein LOC128163564 n=1 Tax=Magallana angulata TaxID=2784310 RepID=UPI0022B14167|nr:uncharacterized protein LOC128163564 [Crassostrea angulata]